MTRERGDSSAPYLAVLVAKSLVFAGKQGLHAGLATNGRGTPFCDDEVMLWEFPLTARDPQFALSRGNGWRHRYAEAALELNKGCPHCLAVLHQIGREAGYSKPRSLAA